MARKYDLDNLGDVKGLSEKEAAGKLASDGFNEIPSAKKRSIFSIGFAVIREPMLLLLLASGAIYMVLGEIRDAFMLLGFVLVIIGITLYQERKTERALEALRDLSSPRALVIRDGQSKRIAGREVVTGDIIVLSEGDRVPADGIVLAANNLTIEESLLTGESVPVTKSESEDATEMGRAGGDNSPFVYSGTLVVGGLAIVRVAATGLFTEFGKIGKSLQSITEEKTLLQKETGRVVRTLALIGGSLCVIMAVAYGISRGLWLEGFLASITLAMAILPEEFPVVLTVFLALGAWRISQSQVLTRRMPAIETLGSNTVLCVDKTGTLTQNRMSVTRICAGGEFFSIGPSEQKAPPEKFHQLIEFSILASQTTPFDPMEKALKDLGAKYQNLTEHMHHDWNFQREYPLSKHLLAISRVWKAPAIESHVIAVKGAPEAIMDLCHLSASEQEGLCKQVEAMAADGLRVLGVARSSFGPAALPGDQHDFKFELLGFVGFADPVRATVPAAIKECYSAGMRVVMITGDYPVTAQHIAREIGLAQAENVVTGLEMDGMTDDVLKERIKQGVNIFARVVPEQKLRLVNAFKANGEIVAMTGDGVNDAPALKSANIGIAMGGRGTDVARESAALVLLDDDFSSIVKAVRLGRRIFDNLRKAMAYILAVHVPIAGLSLLPVLFGWPMVLLPVHVVFLELIIDPACSIAFEAEREEPNIMGRPPRDRKEPLFNRRTVALSLIQGAVVLIVTLTIFGFALQGRGELEARGLAFVTLVVANLGLIFSNRFWSQNILSGLRYINKALMGIVGFTVVILGLVIYVPAIRELFRFGPLHLNDLAISLTGGAICIVWFEVVKLMTQGKRTAVSALT